MHCFNCIITWTRWMNKTNLKFLALFLCLHFAFYALKIIYITTIVCINIFGVALFWTSLQWSDSIYKLTTTFLHSFIYRCTSFLLLFLFYCFISFIDFFLSGIQKYRYYIVFIKHVEIWNVYGTPSIFNEMHGLNQSFFVRSFFSASSNSIV